MEIKDYIHYYLGCEVEYEGIINGKELKAEQQANKHDVFYIPQIKEVKGIKRGFLKRIDQLVDGTRRYRIGRRGLQTHYNTSRFKLVLRRLSSITEEEKKELASASGLNVSFYKMGTIIESADALLKKGVFGPAIFQYLISRGFWLFGDRAFKTGLIIEKK